LITESKHAESVALEYLRSLLVVAQTLCCEMAFSIDFYDQLQRSAVKIYDEMVDRPLS